MGVIIKFRTEQERIEFLSKLELMKPDVAKRARLSKTQSNVLTISGNTREEDRSIREMVEPQTQVFDDVQMETFD
jgi:hypothetical protein